MKQVSSSHFGLHSLVFFCLIFKRFLGNNSGGSSNWCSGVSVSSSKSWGSSVSVSSSSNWGSSSVSSNSWGSSNGSNWGSVNSGDWDLADGVDWGVVGGHDGLGGVGLNSLVVDVGGLDNLLDWVNLVWGWDWDSSWDWDLIRLGNWLLDEDLTGNGSWDSDGDVDVVLVDLDLGDDVGHLWGDSGVGSDWGSDLGLGHGVSWGGAEVSWCWWDGGVWCWGSGDGGWGNGSGLNEVLGSSSNVGGSGLGDGFLSGNGVLVTSDNGDSSGLDLSVSDNTVLDTVLDNGRSGGV